MCSAYTALPDSASAVQYSPTWRRGPRPWGPSPPRYAPLVVVVYCRGQADAQSQPCWSANSGTEAWRLQMWAVLLCAGGFSSARQQAV
jgi:hypothetical protein